MAFTAAYKTEAAKRQVSMNYFVEIEGVANKYSKKAVGSADGFGAQAYGTTAFGSGSVFPTKQFIQENGLQWNPPRVKLDGTGVSVGTLTVKLIDPDGTLLADLSAADVYLKKLSLFIGYSPLAAADYQKVAEYRITQIDMGDEKFTIRAEDNLGRVREPIRLFSTVLTADLAAGATTVTVESTSDFGTTGTGKIGGEEVVSWIGKTATTLTGLSRGLDGSDDEDRDKGETVFQVETVTGNPIEVMLRLLVSPGGGSVHDVLAFGLGLPSADIDIARFETIRDDSTLTDDVYKFELDEDIDDALKFLGREILLWTTTRLFVDDDAKLSLALLDEVIVDDLGEKVEKEDIRNIPIPTSDARKLVNRIFTDWDFGLGRDEFLKQQTHDDAESQTRFGTRIGRTFKSKGIRLSLSGQKIINRFRDRLFRRISTPIFRLNSVTVLSRKQFFVPGEKVILNHDKLIDLPKKKKGFNRIIEILSKKWDLDNARVTYQVNASELLSERWGFIGPASDVASAASASVFTLASGEGAKWKVDWEVALWLKEAGAGPLSTSKITDVTGDTITVTPAFSLTPTTSHRLRFDDYDGISETDDDQRLFAFVGAAGGGNFGDGTGPYLITG